MAMVELAPARCMRGFPGLQEQGRPLQGDAEAGDAPLEGMGTGMGWAP